MTELQKMTDLERALLHIKTRADAWALKEVEKALSQNCVGSTQKRVGNALDMRCDDVLKQIRDAIEREADYQDANVNADVAKGMYMAIEILDKQAK